MKHRHQGNCLAKSYSGMTLKLNVVPCWKRHRPKGLKGHKSIRDGGFAVLQAARRTPELKNQELRDIEQQAQLRSLWTSVALSLASGRCRGFGIHRAGGNMRD